LRTDFFSGSQATSPDQNQIARETVTLVLDKGSAALANTVPLAEAGVGWISALPWNQAPAVDQDFLAAARTSGWALLHKGSSSTARLRNCSRNWRRSNSSFYFIRLRARRDRRAPPMCSPSRLWRSKRWSRLWGWSDGIVVPRVGKPIQLL
jgi:hypothetical protein